MSFINKEVNLVTKKGDTYNSVRVEDESRWSITVKRNNWVRLIPRSAIRKMYLASVAKVKSKSRPAKALNFFPYDKEQQYL